jgi:hypothetical protein
MRSPRPNSAHRIPIVPDRVRAIGTDSFAFVPHRFLRHGFFASLVYDEILLYFFLLLAADRYGSSFYHYDSICSLLDWTLETYVAARNGLIAKDLIAFDGTRFQVLSLPERPVLHPKPRLTTEADYEEHDPATIRLQVHDAIASHGRPRPKFPGIRG